MKQVQLRGGTTQEHIVGNSTGFIGLEREVTVDTTEWTLRVHDGKKIGGHQLSLRDRTYTKDEVDQLIATVVSGGSISLNGYATKVEVDKKSDLTHEHYNYSLLTHSHDEYSQSSHVHSSPSISFGDGETLEYKYQNNLLSNVDLSEYVTMSELANHEHERYSDVNHEHNQYSETDHLHDNNYANISHFHENYITVNEFNEAIIVKCDKIHTHSSNEINFNGSNIDDIVSNINHKLDTHYHNELYYTKQETDDLVNNYDIKNIKQLIDKSEWIYSEANGSYYCQIYHGLNSKFINAKGVSNRGLEYLDIIPLSDNEVYIINDIDTGMNVMISTIE